MSWRRRGRLKREADTRLVQLADLVTEMLNIKHPYDRGIMARKEIEY